jgi:hypothetical protein
MLQYSAQTKVNGLVKLPSKLRQSVPPTLPLIAGSARKRSRLSDRGKRANGQWYKFCSSARNEQLETVHPASVSAQAQQRKV